MSRARILADYVSSGDELALKAPLASPTFTGTIGGGAIGSAVTGFTGIKEADMWRLTSGFGGSDTLHDDMERVDDATFSKIGTGMDFTNGGDGSWTFPSPGIWLIQASPFFYYNSNAAFNQVTIEAYNGSSWDSLTQGSVAIPGGSNSIDDWCQMNAHASAFLDVQNTTNNKVKFVFNTHHSGVQIIADENYNRTYFTFIRLGDT